MGAMLDRLKEHTAHLRWFRQSACLRAGMPLEPDDPPEVKLTIEKQAEPPPAAVATSTAATTSGKVPWVWIAGTAATVLGTTMGYPLAWWLLGSQPNRSPSDPPPAVIREIERIETEGSLLQYLEDQGYHRAQGE